MKSDVHPDHDHLVHVLRDWFHTPFNEMGYRAEKRRWGTYWNIGQVYIQEIPPAQVNPFLADVREYYGDGPVCINVDSAEVDAALGPLLCASGCSPDAADIFLAHVGPVPHRPTPDGVTVEPATESNLLELSETRLKAFANSEVPISQVELRNEVSQRRAEFRGSGQGLLARLHGEPAGIIWWYEDPQDIWLLFLGVRLPFRRLGVGRLLLCTRLDDAYARGCRSVMLNVRTDNADAIRLYNRLGFRDEISWRWRYCLGS